MDRRDSIMADLTTRESGREIRDRFFEQYVDFYNGGSVPENSSADFAYYLECHRKRLDKKGIRAVKKIDRIEDNLDVIAPHDRPPYIINMTRKECNYETDYYKGDALLARSDKETEVLYCNILDKADYQEETISCPNCGHSAGAKTFINGCPMCGTRFKTFKFFPCVTSFYSLPKVYERSSINKGIKNVVAIGICLGVLVALGVFLYNAIVSKSIAAGLFFGIIAGLITGWLGTIIIYLSYSMFIATSTITKMFAQTADTMDITAAKRTRNRLETDMSRYFSDFSYELFEGKIMSLLRAIMYSDDRQNLSIYKGPDNLDFMNDAVDVEYRGACRYDGSTALDGYLHVRMTAYTLCTIYVGDKLSKVQRAFSMELVKKIKPEEDYGFSVHAVNCPTCGSTFDAMHVNKCPNCGHEYHLVEDDWVVILLK